MTHSQLCRQSLSKYFVEVPLTMAYFDKVFPTKDSDKDSATGALGQTLAGAFADGAIHRISPRKTCGLPPSSCLCNRIDPSFSVIHQRMTTLIPASRIVWFASFNKPFT